MVASEFLEVPGCDGYYVCKDGSAYTIWKMINGDGGRLTRVRSDVLVKMKLYTNKNGYWIFRAKRTDGTRVCTMLSIAMLLAFKGPPPDKGMCACHGDGNKNNNAIDNLRWDTRAGNEADKVAHGTSNRGSRNGMCKHSPELVTAIRRRHSEFPDVVQAGGRIRKANGTLHSLAKEFCLTWGQVRAIVHDNWEHLDAIASN